MAAKKGKRPKGFTAFHALMKRLVRVPKEAVDRQIRETRERKKK